MDQAAKQSSLKAGSSGKIVAITTAIRVNGYTPARTRTHARARARARTRNRLECSDWVAANHGEYIRASNPHSISR